MQRDNRSMPKTSERKGIVTGDQNNEPDEDGDEQVKLVDPFYSEHGNAD